MDKREAVRFLRQSTHDSHESLPAFVYGSPGTAVGGRRGLPGTTVDLVCLPAEKREDQDSVK